MQKMLCKICQTEFVIDEKYDVSTYEAEFPEGEFEYVVCSNCNSILIKDIPSNLGQYYDNENYYSFSDFNGIIRFLLSHFHRNYFKFDFIGFLTSFFIQYDESWNQTAILFKKGLIEYDSNILDIGCGNGIFINHLSQLGFKHLEGIEPFLEEEVINENIRIYNEDILNFTPNKKYDLIFFKDSLEHVFNPFETLNKAVSLLSDKGMIMVTIPLKNGRMWDVYKEFSFVLCPPTHICVPSIQGLNELSKSCGLEISNLICDSNEFLLLNSEDKIKGRKQYAEESISSYFNSTNPFKKLYNLYIKKFDTIFFNDSRLTMYQIQKRVNILNQQEETDHATIILRKNREYNF